LPGGTAINARENYRAATQHFRPVISIRPVIDKDAGGTLISASAFKKLSMDRQSGKNHADRAGGLITSGVHSDARILQDPAGRNA
jgi:hypothetical protein